jgi:hypothetical protein
MSPSPGDILVTHIVDEILLTNDSDYENVDEEIKATLRGKFYKELMKILNSPSTISNLEYTNQDGDEVFISDETSARLDAFVPFTIACQNSFGMPSLDGEVDLLTKNRIHFNGYIKFEYDPKKHTVFDPKAARESSDKRMIAVVPPNNAAVASSSTLNSNRPILSKSDQLVNAFEKGRRNLEAYTVLDQDVN